ncbi:O-methyltransferase [Effusibacillus consociatus]|uniref:tRNA 5-hydroxyuridine methyltransferase n=1 Tax=Effusibacillus consociatus TaxID=1117041 RepID=A0ABV9Q1S4_9BACL
MDNELSAYIQGLIPARDELLTRMEQSAEEKAIPILDLETSQLLRVLLRQLNPKKILEVGAAIGYSAIVMAQSCSAKIVTIERDRERAEEALENIQEAGLQDRIELLVGDAFDILPTLYDSFDVVFLDAAKGQYPRFLELVLPLLRASGTLFSDNVFFHGLVAGPEQVKHKMRTIVARLREYNQMLAIDSRLETAFVPIGDGLAVSVKKG